MVFVFMLLYVYLLNCVVVWCDVVIGGLFVVIVFEFVKCGFGYYVWCILIYMVVYGVFVVLLVFLLWVYLSWFIVLFGVMVVLVLLVICVG